MLVKMVAEGLLAVGYGWRKELAVPDQWATFKVGLMVGTNEKRPRRGVFTSLLAERTGLEPATPGVTGRYSNQLNYHSW